METRRGGAGRSGKRAARGPWHTAVALLGIILAGALAVRAEAPLAASSCVTCHTDAAKLAALTPPDPPATEAGEG